MTDYGSDNINGRQYNDDTQPKRSTRLLFVFCV